MTVDKTIEERAARYGDFSDHARIAQALADVMRGTANWDRLSPVAKQSLTVIADKVARILNGDPDYRDNWHDIRGYAKLAEDRCPVASAAPAGWILWVGDPHSVAPEVARGRKTIVRLRSGAEIPFEDGRRADWTQRNVEVPGDILAYRLS